MIKLDNIYRLKGKTEFWRDYDVVYDITLSKRTHDDIQNMIKKPVLAPSASLFSRYAKNQKTFDKTDFNSWYAPQFMKDAVNDDSFLPELNELKELSFQKNIALVCYCTNENEDKCHRSIVGGILKGLGADIDCSDEYLKYYTQFVEQKDWSKSNIMLTDEQKLNYMKYKLSQVPSIGILLDSDSIDDYTKGVIDDAIGSSKLIAITDNSCGMLLKNYLDDLGYNKYLVFNDASGLASKEILSSVDECVISSKSLSKKLLDTVSDYANDKNKYIRIKIDDVDNVISINTPDYIKDGSYKTIAQKQDQLENKTNPIQSSVDYVDSFSKKEVGLFIQHQKSLVSGSNVDNVRNLFEKTPRQIMSLSPESLDEGVDENYKRFYKNLYNELHAVNDKTYQDDVEVNRFYGLAKAGIYDKILDIKGFDKYSFNSALIKDISDNGLENLDTSMFSLKEGCYKLSLPYSDNDPFLDIDVSGGYNKKSIDVVADVSKRENETKIAFSSVTLNTEDESGKRRSFVAPGNTIYVKNDGYISDSVYAVSDSGKPIPVMSYMSDYKLLNTLLYINSSNPDVTKVSDNEYTVGNNKSLDYDKDSFESTRKGHWKAVHTKDGPRAHFYESMGTVANKEDVLEDFEPEDDFSNSESPEI